MTVFAANLITSNINSSQQIKAKLSSNVQTSQVIFNAKIRNYYLQQLMAFTAQADLTDDEVMYEFAKQLDPT